MISSSGPQGETQSSSSVTQQNSSTADEQQQQINELITQWQKMTFDESQISSLIEAIRTTTDLEKQYYGVVGLRRVLCNENNPPINQVLESGVTPKLIEIMQESKEPKIQYEAAWCLTNLCSGTSEQTKRVIDCGVIPGFLSALQSGNFELIDQSIWGLGNIAGDSTEFRDLVIEGGGVEAIANVLENALIPSSKKHGAWALSNCCRGKPEPPFHPVSRAIPVFCKFLRDEKDDEVLNDSAWGLSFISEGGEAIEAILNDGILSVVLGYLSNPLSILVIPCLRIIGNILSGTDEQTSMALKEKELLPTLLSLTTHSKKIVRKETFWIISNITAGQPIQFESIMGNPAFVERIIDAARNDSEEVRKEAIYALSNSTGNGTPAQVIRLLNNGVFKCLVELLDKSVDEGTLVVLLDGVENCLKWGKQFNLVTEDGLGKFVTELEMLGGLNKIESLQMHQSNDVYQRSVRIIETYFEIDEQ